MRYDLINKIYQMHIMIFFTIISTLMNCNENKIDKSWVLLSRGDNIGCLVKDNYCHSYSAQGHPDCKTIRLTARNAGAKVISENNKIKRIFTKYKNSGCDFICVDNFFYCKSFGMAQCSTDVDQDMIIQFQIYN